MIALLVGLALALAASSIAAGVQAVRAASLAADLKLATARANELTQAVSDAAEERLVLVHRYEAAVADLKQSVVELEGLIDAHADPELVRARLRELLSGEASSGATPNPGVPGASSSATAAHPRIGA